MHVRLVLRPEHIGLLHGNVFRQLAHPSGLEDPVVHVIVVIRFGHELPQVLGHVRVKVAVVDLLVGGINPGLNQQGRF